MATVNDIYDFLNDLAPVRYQMDFDNAGFLVTAAPRSSACCWRWTLRMK